MREDIRDVAKGRWRSIHLAAGIDKEHLSGKHTACPCCAGKDRFRWDNKDSTGSSFCNQCGAKTGMDLVMAVKGWDFVTAKRWVLEQVGRSPVETPKVRRGNDDLARALEQMWFNAVPLNGIDPASKYLIRRGIKLINWPTQIRYAARCAYKHDDGKVSHHPAMLAKFVSPDAKDWTLHRTYLDDAGRKAQVPQPKKLMPGPVPKGGAVRLSNSAETMGVAEGIETAWSASLLYDIPVWPTLSDGLLATWQPPPTAKNIIIFADADSSYAGQSAAYLLAKRLRTENYHVEPRMPDELDVDWNDVWLAEQGVLA